MDRSKMTDVQKLISDFAEALVNYEDGKPFVLDIPPALLSEKSRKEAYMAVRVDNVKEDMKARCAELGIPFTDKEIDDYSNKLVNCDYDLNINDYSYSEYLDSYIKAKPQDIRTKLIMALTVHTEDPETSEIKPEQWYYWKDAEGRFTKDVFTDEKEQAHSTVEITRHDILQDWKSANMSTDFTGEMEIVVPLDEDLFFAEEKEAEVEEIEGR